MRANVAGIVAVCAASVFFANSAAAQECPNPGERKATAADVALMKTQGYGDYAKEGNCWNPSSRQAGAAPGEAKQFLRSILCPPDADNYGGLGPDGTIQGLDGQFAVCAAKFLKAARDGGMNVCIREGARSAEKQREYASRPIVACKHGARCEHPRGIAIDVNVRPNIKDCKSYARLHQSAPSFGVNFYLGCRDAYHFVPMRGASCSSGGVIQPERDYDYPQYYRAPTPTSGLTDQFRQALGMPTQPPISTPPATPAPPPTVPSLPQPTQSQFCIPDYKCTGNTLMFQNSFCATQTVQMCTAGCTNGACIVRNATSSTSTSTTVDTTSGTGGSASSTLDILEYITGITAEPTDVGTSTPLQLLLGLTEDQVSTEAPTSTQPLASTSVLTNVQYITAQQTFVSSDLSQSAPVYAQPAQNTSTLFVVLENLKSVLLWALQYLQPFEISRMRNPAIDGHAVNQ